METRKIQTPATEVRTFRADLQAEPNGRKVTGYAAVFNSRSQEMWGFVEEIDARAFDEADMSDVRALFNHDPNLLLARTPNTLKLSVDERGLRYEFDLPDTTAGADLAELLRRGDVTQSSFGFTIDQDEWEEREGELPLRRITKIKRLFDVSPVTYPAYQEASVALRSLERWREEHQPKEEPKQINTPLRDRAEALIL